MRLLHKTSAMESLRKWFYKPKRDDRSLLAQFFYADETLNMVAAELDSFDGREDPLRCSVLVNQLRHAQEHVLNITGQIMDQLLGSERVPRDFRVKFPEDVLQENLAGQLWFGAECLAAGSSIMNREEESAAMRPLAKALTRSLETVRRLLREHCLRCNQLTACTHILHESLNILDRLFAEFELCYVSAMVPVKSPREFEVQQHICVLFSETLQRARKIGLLTQEQVDDYDPALMFAIPRLSIVSGLLIYSAGPLSIAKSPDQMSDMFRPFRTLLLKIRSLLWTLDRRELYLLEKLLCTNEDTPSWRLQDHQDVDVPSTHYPEISSYVSRFYSDHSHCRDVLEEMGWSQDSKQGTSSIITADDYLPEDMEIAPILESMQRLDDIVAQQTPPANLMQSHVLSMFDPLAEGPSSSGFSTATSDGNVLLPDQTLVSNLSDQVSEIADKLSAISYSEQTQNPAEYPRNFTSMDGNMINNQMYSFSSNDVSSLVPNPTEQQEYQMARDNVNFSPSRSDKVISQLNNMPSTSAGYLIPNAISQEPIILAAMSNSAILLDDGGIINPINSSLIMNHSDNMLNFDSDYENAMGTTNYLINDGFQNRFTIPQEIQNITIEDHNVEEPGCSASERIVTMESVAEEDSNCERNKSRIVVGYGESDLNEPVANDSGICTENTSLDRSPDSEIRDLNSEQQPVHYRDQNCMLNNENKNIDDCKREMKNVFSSDSTGTVRISVNGGDFSQDQSVSSLQMNYAETSGSDVKNEAGTSHADFSPSLSATQTSNTEQIENVMHMSNGTHMSNAVQTSSAEQTSSAAQASSDISDSDNVANKTCDNLGRNDQTNNDSLAKTKTPSSRDLRRTQSAGDVHPGSSSGWMPSLSQKKPKRTSSSTRSSSSRFPRRLSSRVWSQGRVMLENRSYVQRVSPVKLNLDQLVEDSLAGSCSSQSSATSSFHSETADDEEIALALQAQELAARRHIRTTSSEDLIHRLFVCIAGVADQLQTNFASDLRNILKSVFIMNQTPEVVEPEKEEEEEPQQQEDEETQQPVVNNKEETIEYQVSESEVLTNGDSFDSIYSAEEVYADNSPTSQRSRQSLQLDDDNAVLDENAQNDLNERRNSQPSQHSRSNNSVARRNTTISVYKNADNQSSSSMRSSSSNEQEAQEFSESNLVKEELRLISAKCEVAGEGQPGQGVAPRPVERAPEWVPDVAAPDCMLCSAHFTAFRRRHHCRNCGKVFCASCSANSIPLPRFGQLKPVRVCEECYRNLGRSHITEHDSPQQQRMQTAGRSQS